MTPPRLPLLGVSVSAVNLPLALTQLQEWIESRQPNYVCVAPAHSLMECVDNPALYPVFNSAGMVTPDGMAVVWLLRLRGQEQVRRVYGPDLLLAACQHGLKPGWRHYFYGGAPGVADALAESLKKRFPGLQVAGTCSPPFGRPGPAEQEALNEPINASHADLVWVGMGSPWQESWMNQQHASLEAPVLLGVGAAFDFLTGRKPQAPRWMQRSGLEWLFRLASEPQRLWPRYKHYPRFAWLALAELARLRNPKP
jgi:N-acetylglucosaminyldiphosphoundecaprenol N-acetyl-beta-D-mannosaminyltransferase